MSSLFLTLQKALKNPPKTKTAKIGDRFSYKYADLEGVLDTVMPVIHSQGLTLHQPLIFRDNSQLLQTKLKSGELVIESSEVKLPDIQDPQKFGAALTYYRRYAICSLLGITSEDDTDAQDVKPKQPQIKPVIQTQKSKENLENFEPANYQIQVSKKLVGRKLMEIPTSVLCEFRDYLAKNKRDPKGEMDMQMINAFLNHGMMTPK